MYKYVIYARKSSDESSKNQKASLGDQIKWAEEYCKSKGIEAVEVFQESMSAKEIGRPIFNKMIKGFYDGKYDCIITWSIDRLSRNSLDEWQLKHLIAQKNIKEVHTKESVFTEAELFTFWIFLSLGEQEISQLRKRVMRRLTNMIAEWKVPYKTPYGYMNLQWGAVENPEEAKVLKYIFELRTQNKLSLLQIADRLNAEWIKPRGRSREGDTRLWKTSTVEQILKNDFYIGIVRFSGMIGEWVHNRIISRDIFEKANEENRVNIGHKQYDFHFKGLITDSDGKYLTASLSKGKYVFYHTQGWGISISQTEIFKRCSELVKKWVIPSEMMWDLEKEVKRQVGAESRAIMEELSEARNKYADNERKLENLLDIFTEGIIDKDEYSKKKFEYLTTRVKLKETISGFWALEMTLEEKYQKIIELLRDLYWAYTTGDDAIRGVLLTSTIIELKIDDEKRLYIKQKEPFQALSESDISLWQPH